MFDFPDLVFVTRHGCEPWTELAVKLMLKWPGLHYSTSAFAPKYYPKDVIDFANTRGADKIIYAGYFPMGLSLERIMTEMRDVGFKDEVWPKFLRTNALRVLGLDGLSRPTARTTRPPPTRETPMTIDYTTFDADNHYYEATDAFTRYLDPGWPGGPCSGPRSTGASACWWPARSTASSPTRTFDPVARPGSLDEYFRGRNPRRPRTCAALFGDLEPIRPEYRDRDARLAVMDAQGIDGCFLFPTLGRGDGGGAGRRPRGRRRRLPRLQPVARRRLGLRLPGPDLRRAHDPAGRRRRRRGRAGGRSSTGAPASSASRAGRPTPATGLISPADPRFDPFWARVDEAGRDRRASTRGTPATAATSTTGSRRGDVPGVPPTRRCASC